MHLDGSVHTAVLSSSPSILQWNDGSTWVREELQGDWKDESDGIVRATVINQILHWNTDAGETAELSPFPIFPRTTIQLTRQGASINATFEPGPPAKLVWSHGKVWVRCM